MGIGEAVITVVPQHHETEIVHGREHRCPGADHDCASTATYFEEGPVARSRTEIGGQGGGIEPRGTKGCVQPGDIASVGRHDQHATSG